VVARSIAITVARLALGAAAIVLVTVSAPVRESLVALEPAVPSVLFTAALAWVALGWTTRSRGNMQASRRLRRLEARAARTLEAWGWALAILLFLLPLWSHWAMRPLGPVSAFAAPFGGIPWSDSHAHLEGGNRLLAGDAFGPFSERRPLTASLLGVRLALGGGSLRFALLIQAVLLALSAWLVSRLVGGKAGLGPAVGAFALILGLSRDFLPTAATEPLGITFSCLGVAVLLMVPERPRLTLLALGFFAVDAALHARPGPQLLLPILAVWALYAFRRAWTRAAAVLLIAGTAGGLSTMALNALYGVGESSFTAYPAYTLYGLTRSSNWRQARQDFPEEIARIGRETDVARFLYQKAFANLRRDPTDFLRALGGNEAKFLQKLPANLTRTVSLRALFVASVKRVRPSRSEVVGDLMVGLPVILAAALGFVGYLRRSRGRVEILFWGAVGLGIVLSVPFVYGDAGFRGLAAAYPFLAVALALGLSRAPRRPVLAGARLRAERLGLICGVLALALVGTALVGPAVARAFAYRPAPHDLQSLVPGRHLVVSPAGSPAVVVTHARPGTSATRSRIERGNFLRLLDLAGLDADHDAYLRGLRSPFVLVSTYDFVARRQQLIVGPVEILRQGRAFLKLEVSAAPVANFVEVVRWEALGRPAEASPGPSSEPGEADEEEPAPDPEPTP
jgi:hypothetical protein